MERSEADWKKHFESLDTESLLDLFASPALLHREMVKKILFSRGRTEEGINASVRQRQKEIEHDVEVAGPNKNRPEDFGPISPDIYAWRNLFLLIMFCAVLSLALSVAAWWYLGLIAGIVTLAASTVASISLTRSNHVSNVLQKMANTEYAQDKKAHYRKSKNT